MRGRMHPKQFEHYMKIGEKIAKGDRGTTIRFLLALGMILVGLILITL